MDNNLSVSDDKKKYEELNIVKHGTNYIQSEEKELQEKYPFCLCPECLSSNTKIIKRFRGDSDELFGATTGTIHSMGDQGIFLRERLRVNYQCQDCDCQWSKLYPVKDTWFDVDTKKVIPWILGVSGVLCLLIGLIGLTALLQQLNEILSIEDRSIFIAMWLIPHFIGILCFGLIKEIYF